MSKRKYNCDNPDDLDIVMNILYDDEVADNVDDNDDPVSEASETEDFVEEIEEVGDVLTYDGDDSSVNVNSPPQDDAGRPIYTSKSGMEWEATCTRSSRRQNQNILRNTSGLTISSRNVTTVSEAFMLFLDSDIMQTVVNYTNQKANYFYQSLNLSDTNNKRVWIPTNIQEMYAFVGVLLVMGALKAKREPLSMLWSTDPLFERKIFPASFSRTRFTELLKFIRFDDLYTREERKKNDKMCAVREIFTSFSSQCQLHYYPGSHLTVDEQLVGFRGRCPFRVYMKSKPAKYGIKIWMLCDVETSYAMNLQVYTGKEGPRSEKNQGCRVVLDLTHSLKSGYGITTDNFFTSIPLAQELLKRGLTLTGTLRKNKTEIPAELQPMPARKELSSMFAFNGNLTVVSYAPQKK